MTLLRIHARPPDPVKAGFDELRAELDIPGPFPSESLAEAAAAAAEPATHGRDATDLPLFTIDPPNARDLDQAMHIDRRDDGYRVHYAIADLAAFVEPGGALDAEVWRRGVTYYAPDAATPLHPEVLSAGAASLLPGETRPAVLWTLDLDAGGALVASQVARARVCSRERLDYAGVQARLDDGSAGEPLRLLAEVGTLRQRLERERGGVSLPLPDQEVICGADGRWDVAYRTPLPVDGYNAQISLLTGMAAAQLMIDAGAGILRTLPGADARVLRRLRRAAEALGRPWPDGMPYPEFIRTIDPAAPRGAALLQEATGVMRGAGYAAFDGAVPERRRHGAIAADYAHVTAPLRRLADRYALECSLAACAGEAPPAWVRERLAELPKAMADADRRANALERAAVDLVEAARLAGRVGETFPATVIDDDVVALADPAVRAHCDGDPPVGERVTVRLIEADPATRSVRFELVR